MSESDTTTAAAERLDRIYREKAAAEIAAADALLTGADVPRSVGDELADIMLLKGEPGIADREAGYVLAGADGEAAHRALDALGLPAARYAACTHVGTVEDARTRRLRLLVEAVDPRVVIALDPIAATDFAAAYDVVVPTAGVPTVVLGRRFIALGGLEASLADERAKRAVWKQLKALQHSM